MQQKVIIIALLSCNSQYTFFHYIEFARLCSGYFLSRNSGCSNAAITKQKSLEPIYLLKRIYTSWNMEMAEYQGELVYFLYWRFHWTQAKYSRINPDFQMHRCLTGIFRFVVAEPRWESGPGAGRNAIWYLNGNFLCMCHNNASDLTFGFVVTKYYHMYNLTFLTCMNAWPWTPSNLLEAVKIISVYLQ